MKYYAVIDTNFIVSYLLTHDGNSTIHKLINVIKNQSLIPLYNDDILCEYTEVLSRERFHFTKEEITDTIGALKSVGINCSRKPVQEVFPDPDDIVFYEVAMSREDSYLVTGNLKHFPHNGRVVSPSDMLYIMEYGEKGPGLLNEPEGPYYLPIPLDEINAIIREVRMKIQG